MSAGSLLSFRRNRTDLRKINKIKLCFFWLNCFSVKFYPDVCVVINKIFDFELTSNERLFLDFFKMFFFLLLLELIKKSLQLPVFMTQQLDITCSLIFFTALSIFLTQGKVLVKKITSTLHQNANDLNNETQMTFPYLRIMNVSFYLNKFVFVFN